MVKKLESRQLAIWGVAFVLVQAAGYLVPRFANVHTDPLPLIVGVFLLLPGTLLGFVLPQQISSTLQIAIISSINLVVWFGVARFLQGGNRSAAHAHRPPRRSG